MLNEQYAIQIARDWNAKRGGKGYVTRFEIASDFVKRYTVQTVGASIQQDRCAHSYY